MKLGRCLVLAGSIVLFAGALLHLLGYSRVVPVLVGSGLNPTILGAFKAVWLAFSVQFLVLAPGLIWISRRFAARSLLLYLALIPVIDAVLMYHFVGLFIGTYMVAGGALLLLAGAWILPYADLQ